MSSSVQFSSVTTSCPIFCSPTTAAHQASLSVHHQLSELAQTHVIKSVMPSNHLLLCRPLLLPPSVFPSIRVFSKVSVLCIRWPKYWSFSFSISSSNEYSGLISFRMVGSPCSPRDAQESSPIPQFQSISSCDFSFMLLISFVFRLNDV